MQMVVLIYNVNFKLRIQQKRSKIGFVNIKINTFTFSNLYYVKFTLRVYHYNKIDEFSLK